MRRSAQIRNRDARDEGKHDSGIRDEVWKNHVLGVDENQCEQCRSKDEIERQRRAQAIVPCNRDEQRCG